MARPKMLVKKQRHAINAWVDKDLFDKAKVASYEQGLTITQLIEDAMRRIIAKERRNGKRKRADEALS